MRIRVPFRFLVAAGFCLAAFGFAVPPRARAQDIWKTLALYVKAEGGAGKLAKITTVKFEGTVVGERSVRKGRDAFVAGVSPPAEPAQQTDWRPGFVCRAA